MRSALQRGAGYALAVLWEIVLVAGAALVYFGVRGQTEGAADEAFANARTVERIEESLGIAWEHAFQSAILGHEWLVTGANWVYVYGHWPVIAASAVVLYAFRRERYVLLRNAMFISGLCGFAFFAFGPVAPPRLADPAIVDTVTLYSEGYRTLQPPSLTNQFAAMPSLHAGWNVLLGIVIFATTTNVVLRAFAVAMPAAMVFSVVATGNHYALDVVVGVVLVLFGLFVAARIPARTLSPGEPETRSQGRPGRPALRRRPSFGQLARGGPGGRASRRARDRGGRASVPRSPGAAAPEDGRTPPAPVGSVDAREPVRSPASPR
jgi:membrane-associated phospholipid phosphatase